MSYKLKFREEAKKEWEALDSTIQSLFAKKLKKILQNPHIPNSKLSGMPDCYKIKLRASGFRLVYQVKDSVLIVIVVAVGKRERSKVYNEAKRRLV